MRYLIKLELTFSHELFVKLEIGEECDTKIITFWNWNVRKQWMNGILSVSNEMRAEMNENIIINSSPLSSMNFYKSCKHNHHMNDFAHTRRNMKIGNEWKVNNHQSMTN